MLDNKTIENNKNKIISELKYGNYGNPCDENIDYLIDFMVKGGFFEGPSSIKYHQNYEGGNAEHAIQVFDNLDEMNLQLGLGIPQKSIILTSLLHDICKIDCYFKRADGEGYSWNPNSEPGHGAKSVKIIEKFIKLNDMEREAIAVHMGAYERNEYDWSYLSEVYRRNKLAYYLHVADMRSTYGF